MSAQSSLAELVNELTDLFHKRDYSAVIAYRVRGEDEASINVSASMEELVDMAAAIALVAAEQVAQSFNISGDNAALMVRDAVAEGSAPLE